MRSKLLLALAIAGAVIGGGTGRANATTLQRLNGATCVDTTATGDIAYSTSAGSVFNRSTTTTRNVVCPIPMPIFTFSGSSVAVGINFLTPAAVSCSLTLSSKGATQNTVSGTSTSAGSLALSVTLGTSAVDVSASLRCALPPSSNVKGGTQALTDFFVSTP